MASYKVLQDIEAEDKLIGPLSFKQFVYALICAGSLGIIFFVSTHGLAFLSGLFVPVAVFFGFLAFPWGGDQSTEIWALAKIRFLIKPRRRIWDQSGFAELVTITAPQQISRQRTSGLSQAEVRSRLRVLADTIDSRGWAIKSANVNLYTSPVQLQVPESDRLVAGSTLPQEVSGFDVQAADDMLDEKNNPRAQAMESMIEASTRAHRQKIVDELKETAPAAANPAPAAPQNFWFLNQPSQPQQAIPKGSVTFGAQLVEPGVPAETAAPAPNLSNVDEAALVQELEAHKEASPTASYYGHMHTIQPLSAQKPKPLSTTPVIQTLPPSAPTPPVATPTSAVAPIGQPAHPATPVQPLATAVPTINQKPAPPAPPTPDQVARKQQLAQRNDLNIDTIARQANDDEVVIKLH